MPSVKPRLALTLPEHRHALLKRLAALQGVSMASLVTELLEECYPVLERICVMLEAAKRASEDAKDGLRESCDKAMAEIEPYRDAASAQFDLFVQQFVAASRPEIEGAPARGDGSISGFPGTSPDALNPRVVTRGSGSTDTPPIPHVRKSRKPSAKGVSK